MWIGRFSGSCRREIGGGKRAEFIRWEKDFPARCNASMLRHILRAQWLSQADKKMRPRLGIVPAIGQGWFFGGNTSISSKRTKREEIP